ncbi:MAG: hypothetical protein KatS3mg129_1487 [Leptospiraceae bacterium]|nr:MAG: hypothetical protein KatS3mg129_1487 [Leptospiraceae bacterium]
MYRIFVILFLFISMPLYSQYELGINLNAGIYYPNKFIHSLYHTYFTYYQFNKVHLIKKESLTLNYDKEIYFIFYEILNPKSFARIGLGNYQISPIYSYYLSYNNQYKIKWSGEYNSIYFDFGNAFSIKRNIEWEIFGGIGYIPDFRFYYKQWETNQKMFKEPFEYDLGKFYSSEGMLFRLGINLLLKKKPIHFRIGLNYQYILSNLFQSKKENIKWFWIDQNKIWITEDLTEYIKNKEQYEEENQNILKQFPSIESVKPYLSSSKLFFSIGYNF